RELEKRVQAGTLARPEAIAQLLEVAGEEAGRVAVTLRCLEGELLRLSPGETNGRDERRLELREPLGERLGTGPHREHHRQARALEPEAAEIVVRRRVLERRLERGVTAQQPCVRLPAQRNVPC